MVTAEEILAAVQEMRSYCKGPLQDPSVTHLLGRLSSKLSQNLPLAAQTFHQHADSTACLSFGAALR